MEPFTSKRSTVIGRADLATGIIVTVLIVAINAVLLMILY